MEIIVKQAIKEDWLLIIELTNKAYAVPFKQGLLVTKANDSEEKILNEIEEGSTIFTAVGDDKIVGAVRCQPIGKNVRLYKLAVDPNYRNLGIGSKLVSQILEFASTVSAEKVVIEVVEEKGLIPFYESFGFTSTEKIIVKDHIEVAMEKKLLT